MNKFTDLRRRAQQKITRQSPPDVSNLSTEEITNLLEELRIHQAELEIQNEDLRQTQQQLELSRQQYVDLYDLAPTGYLTLDPEGQILNVNSTGAQQLGAPRHKLIDQPFTHYISPADQDVFYLHRLRVLESKAKESCELQLVRADGVPFEAQLESIVTMDETALTSRIQMALIDITERKQLRTQLTEERNLLRTLIDHVPDYIYVKDRHSQYLLGNVALAQMMGAETVDDLIGKTDFDFYPHGPAAKYHESDQTVIHTGQPLINKTEPLVDSGGRRMWLSTTKVPLRNVAGQITGLVGIGRDITERTLREERINLLQTITQTISEAPNFYGALQSALGSIGEATDWDYGEVWILDEQEQVLRCSAAWYGNRETFKSFREQSCTLTFPANVGLPGRAWASRSPVWIRDVTTLPESRFVRRRLALDTGLKAALAAPFLANHQVVVVLVFFMLDPSPKDAELVDLISTVAAQLGLALHRKKVQDDKEQLLQAVSRQQEDLRSLAGRLAETQEAERRRLAQELHDRVGQNLTALGFNLSAIQKQLVETGAGSDSVPAQVRDSLSLIEETTDRIRNVLAELRPPMLEEYGLGEALAWYADHFTARTALPVEIRDELVEPRLPPTIEITLFRITQEALINAAKYAQAGRVVITLAQEDHAAQLVIADDGVGFDPVAVANDKQRHSLGLLTMQERALAIKGQCRIESRPGQGARVIVEVPRS